MNPCIEDYQNRQPQYLAKAEKLFGSKTEYGFIGVYYHALGPRTVFCEKDEKGIPYYMIQLCRQGAETLTDGIFQLSHEVVHLLSPVEIDNEENEVNYLEEGMAVYFSKIITESETEDLDFCKAAIETHPQYLKAYDLYLALINIDNDAVIKLRRVTPVIANIQPQDFAAAGLNVPEPLIHELLTKFNINP
jgi:hypothetical protein